MCNVLNSIKKQCKNNIGGLDEIYVIDQKYISNVIENNNVISSISVLNSQLFLSIYQIRNTSNYTEELVTDFNSGTSIYNTILNLVFNRRDKSISLALSRLAEGQRDLAFIVKDVNGLYWYLPYMRLTNNGNGSGTNKADGSKYEVTFSNDNDSNINEIDSSIISSLISSGDNYIIDEFGDIIAINDTDLLVWI